MSSLEPHRRGMIAGTLAVAAAPAVAPKAITDVRPDEMALGSPKAKVTVVEYASLSCPHCARWANEVFPAFKTRYVDTGKVRYILREFVTSPPEVAVAGWLTARCAGKDKYFDVVAAVFRDQEAMYQSGDVRGVLLKIAEAAGLTEAQFDACLKDDSALAALKARLKRYEEDDKIDSTPTFLVNDQRLEGEQTLEAMAAAIAKASHGRRR